MASDETKGQEQGEKEMKTAYELAMERFARAETGPALSAEQKEELAAIDRETQARIAEQEILMKSRLQAAAAAGNMEEAVKIREEMGTELRRLRERGEAKKEEVRKRGR
jgi:hypothetical protein